MWVFTTAGFFEVVAQEDGNLSFLLLDKESADALADGIELVAGKDRPEVAQSELFYFVKDIAREDYVAYMDQEITHFLDYRDFLPAMEEARGKEWADNLKEMLTYMMRLK